jgi:hypothetical protein
MSGLVKEGEEGLLGLDGGSFRWCLVGLVSAGLWVEMVELLQKKET